MAVKMRWLWVLLAIPLGFAAWFLLEPQANRPVEQAEQAAEEAEQIPGALQEQRPAPSYNPLSGEALQEHDPETDYLLSGQVTSELAEPLAGAIISLRKTPPRWSPPDFVQPAPLQTKTCDEEGRYQFRLSAPANLWVHVQREGYVPIDAFLPVRDPSSAVRNFQLRPAQSSVVGLVLNKEEIPIGGATVVANPPLFALMADSMVLAPTGRVTDPKGQYILDGLQDGDVSLIACAPGHVQQEELVSVRAGQPQQLNFHLSPAESLSFEVKNSRGDSIPYAAATAPGFFKIAGSDQRGRLNVALPRELSPIQCTVSADGYLPHTFELDPKAPPAAIVLEQNPVLAGRVLSESGQAIAGARVTVFGTGGAQGKFEGAAETEKSGRFTFLLAYPPVREIQVSKTGYFDHRLAFEGGKPAPANLVIKMKRIEAGIYGRVVDYKGIPVRRFVVHVKNPETGSDYQRSFNSESGAFMITDVAPGTYTLIIQSVLSATTDTVQLFSQDGLEFRKGFLFGEILAQFPKPAFTK